MSLYLFSSSASY